MQETRKKALMARMDYGWLALAAELVGDDEESGPDVPFIEPTKAQLMETILAVREEEPAFLLFLLHQGIISLMMDHCGEFLEAKITQKQKEKIKKELLADLQNVSESDYELPLPNHALLSSAAFAEWLVLEGILPDLLLTWGGEVQDTISSVVIAYELWNLITFYGVITPEDLLRVHASSHGEPDPLPMEILGLVQGYIELNLSEDIFYENVDDQDYFQSEYMDMDPDQIMEDAAAFDGDYKIVSMDRMMNMLHGISPFELLKLVDYITRAFELDEEQEEVLGDVRFLHAIMVELKGRDAKAVPRFFTRKLGWKWGVEDKEARELIFQEMLEQIPRFHLKGHSAAELSGESDEEPEDGEEGFFNEEEIPEELKFKMRKPKAEDDQFLN